MELGPAAEVELSLYGNVAASFIVRPRMDRTSHLGGMLFRSLLGVLDNASEQWSV